MDGIEGGITLVGALRSGWQGWKLTPLDILPGALVLDVLLPNRTGPSLQFAGFLKSAAGTPVVPVSRLAARPSGKRLPHPPWMW
jgi:hypothetical protein